MLSSRISVVCWCEVSISWMMDAKMDANEGLEWRQWEGKEWLEPCCAHLAWSGYKEGNPISKVVYKVKQLLLRNPGLDSFEW